MLSMMKIYSYIKYIDTPYITIEIVLPVFPMQSFIDGLSSLGVDCKVGNFYYDISNVTRPYLERWLLHRDGFVKIHGESIDYIGIEDVMRMGPFYNAYCIIENRHIIEDDYNAHKLLDAEPYFSLCDGRVTRLGWSGGVLAGILTKDTTLYNLFSMNIANEETRKLSVKVVNFACIVETRIWDPSGLLSIYKIVDRIGVNVRKLLKQIHLGDDADI